MTSNLNNDANRSQSRKIDPNMYVSSQRDKVRASQAVNGALPSCQQQPTPSSLNLLGRRAAVQNNGNEKDYLAQFKGCIEEPPTPQQLAELNLEAQPNQQFLVLGL